MAIWMKGHKITAAELIEYRYSDLPMIAKELRQEDISEAIKELEAMTQKAAFIAVWFASLDRNEHSRHQAANSARQATRKALGLAEDKQVTVR